MIIRDLQEMVASGNKTIHQLIDESLDTYPIEVEERWRDYASGNVDDLVSPKRKRQIGAPNAKSPQQNMIRMCLRQIVGRFRFRRFVVEGDERKQAFLDDYQMKNDFTRIAVSAARRALIDGNAAISQAWRGDPATGMVYTRQEYWRNTLGYGIFVAVDDVHNPVWAVSDFRDNDDVDRRVIYLPDRILHYYKGGTAEPQSEWALEREDPWLMQDGTPIGVPVSHFPNSDPDYGPYGTSTVGEVVAAQDALNLSLFNRMAVSALTGQQMYWGTGVAKPQEEIGPGTFVSSDNVDSRFGVLPAGSIDGLMLETDDLRGVISGAFPVPSYRLGSGDWPSGLALQRSDGPMITAVRLLRDVIEPGLIHHAHRATVMANAFGARGFDLESRITVEWDPIDEIDPSTEAEIQQARVDALSGAEQLTKVGMKKTGLYDDAEIEEIAAERKESAEEAMLLAQSETDI